jgi:hypothetical protein
LPDQVKAPPTASSDISTPETFGAGIPPGAIRLGDQHIKNQQQKKLNKMKALKMRIQKSSRWLVIVLATVVLILTTMVVANASLTFTTPNAVKMTYSLAAGANSAVITPATNTSVSVMGCCTTSGTQSVGQVSLLSSSSFIEWVGLESVVGAAITSGSSATANTHIVYIDGSHQVDIRVASGSTILVHNGAAATRAGSVTLIW